MTTLPSHVPPGHGREQVGGRQIVAADVPYGVEDLPAPAHHGGVVHNRVDAAQHRLHTRLVAQVTVVELHALGQVRGDAIGMGLRQQRVDDPHLVAIGQQRLDDVPADEPRASGDQDSAHCSGTRQTKPVK
jgi:hypothetical protein